MNSTKKFEITCKMNDYSSPFQHIYWKKYSVKSRKVFTHHSGVDKNIKNLLHAAFNSFTCVIVKKGFYHNSSGIFYRIHFLVKTIIFTLLLFSRRDFKCYYFSTFPSVNNRVKYSSFDNISLYIFFSPKFYLIEFHKRKAEFPHGSFYYENCFSDCPSFM